MSANCPDCGALLTGEVCLSCGYRIPRELAREEPGAGPEPSTPETRPRSPSQAESRPESASGAQPTGGPEPQARRPTRPEMTGTTEPAPAASGTPPPWERRPRQGFFRALWTTWRDSVFRPVQFFRSLQPEGPVGPALAYYTLFLAFGMFFALYWSTLETILGGGVPSLPIGELGLQLTPEQELTLLIAGTFVYFVFAVVFSILGLFLSAAIVHVGFVVVGAGRQGFSATFRGLAYSGGPLAFALFPFFGGLISLVWLTVLAFIAVREVQRTTNLRAALGFSVPIFAIPVLMFLFVFIIGLILSAADVAAAA